MKPPIPTNEDVASATPTDEPAIAGNRFSINLFIIAFFFTGAVLAWLTWSTYDLYTRDTTITEQVWRAGELRNKIIHLDEVLTMSARMAAATGDPQWEQRYRIFEPQLDDAIKEIMNWRPSQMVAETDAANIKLVEMENRAFTLVRGGHAEEAHAILSREDYETQKRIYTAGMSKFFAQLETRLNRTHHSERQRAVFSAGAGIVVLAILLFSGLATVRWLYKSHAVLLNNITKRKQAEDVLRTAHSELALRVQERTTDLTIANTALKQEIGERRLIEAELEQARDAALESVRLKSEFLANMSHEIRTPMNGVIGMTDLLLETALPSPQREYTETIQSSAEALLTIINDILDFSKIEAGLMRFETIDFELRGVVEAPVELLAERAQAKGLELASLVYEEVPTALRGDPGRLRQVLTNLIGNAVKFTDRGEVVIIVAKVSETESHAMLRFEIQDTGIGISTESQRGLFRAFRQADGSTTRKYGGTGLGLAISKQLVELMGGEIGIDSAPGDGSTFWFTGEFEKQLTPASMVTEPPGNLSGTRVLIVDDNAANRNILKHQTSSWGMVATKVESGERALELLRAGVAQGEPYDIALLDLMMPDMNGFQLAEVIKSDPTIASAALVLLPSFGMLGHGERARQTGIAAYLQKPVRQSQLYDCLRAVMAGSNREAVTVSRLVTRHSMREAEVQQKDKTFSSVRILVAEDNVVNQKVALRQLYNLGYRAEVVPNGRELLKALETNPVDIILMDCQMPEMDGFAATEEIRRREGTARHTTIIAMTANALDGDHERCLAAGMDDYLSKPVKSDALRLKLERWTKPGESGKSLSEGNEAAHHIRGGVIDQAQLASLREIQEPGEDFVTELIDLFLNEATAHLKALYEALMLDDAVEIHRVAHCLKGSSANMGATQMAAISEELETIDPAKDAGEFLAQLENEFELVREALKAERKEAEDEHCHRPALSQK